MYANKANKLNKMRFAFYDCFVFSKNWNETRTLGTMMSYKRCSSCLISWVFKIDISLSVGHWPCLLFLSFLHYFFSFFSSIFYVSSKESSIKRIFCFNFICWKSTTADTMTISENQLPQIQSVGPMNFQIKESSMDKQELNSGCQHWNSQLML